MMWRAGASRCLSRTTATTAAGTKRSPMFLRQCRRCVRPDIGHGPLQTGPRRVFSSTSAAERAVTVGMLRETYDRWERRTALTPEHVEQLLQSDPEEEALKVLVQPCSKRIFSGAEYERAGAVLQDDLSSADLVVGVKRPVNMRSLPSDKTYMFFSHTVKGQPENMGLLKDCLDMHSQLIDYELLMQPNGNRKRLVAFGRYAGMAGMMDSFHAVGQRLLFQQVNTPFLQFPPAIMHESLQGAEERLVSMGNAIAERGLETPEPLVFAVTGQGGAVHGGAMEILKLLPHEIVNGADLPGLFEQNSEGQRQHKIYIAPVGLNDIYCKHDQTDSTPDFEPTDFFDHPADYRCLFADKVAPYCHALINCTYWDARFPRLLTKAQTKEMFERGQDRLFLLSDISCDVNGSVEFFERTTSLDRPFFQYDPLTEQVVAERIQDQGITVLGVDILPTELAKESSQHFGSKIVGVVRDLVRTRREQPADAPGIDTTRLEEGLAEACITTPDGKLTPRYQYLEAMLKQAFEKKAASAAAASTAEPSAATAAAVEDSDKNTVLLSLQGHLFDSGLMNQILDVVQHQGCGVEFRECYFPPHSARKRMKSSAVVKITANEGNSEDALSKVQDKIRALVQVIEPADATMERVGGGYDDGRSGGATATVTGPVEQPQVLVLGAGLVSGSVVDYLARRGTNEPIVTVASDQEEQARRVAALAGQYRGRHVALDVQNNPGQLSELIQKADVVLSLLPAPMHASVVAPDCIEHGVDLVTASYESDEMRELAQRAADRGIFVVNEVGLDPGLDHCSAMRIMDDVTNRGGHITGFSSVCGGLPEPSAAADNPLRYKFSWSPAGVLRASQNDARYRWEGGIVEVAGQDLLSVATPFTDNWPELQLECLPNRDSLLYEQVYGLDDRTKTLFRGTLRYQGFSGLMHVFKNMGLFDDNDVGAAGGDATWQQVVEQIASGRGIASVKDLILRSAGGNADQAAKAMETLEWLGILGDSASRPSGGSNKVMDAFCHLLEEKLCFLPGQHDMVAMHHTIDAHLPDGSEERHLSSLQCFGDESASAMSKTVGFTAAAAVDLVLSKSLDESGVPKGLVLPNRPAVYEPLLAHMEDEGIVFEESCTVVRQQPTQAA